jgi:uncharacterized protein YneF (UPF0154 family)
MRRKLYVILLVVALLASVMAGCSSANKSESAGSAQSPRATAQAEFNESKGWADDYDSAAPAEKPAYTESDMADREMSADSLAGLGGASVDVTNVILAERKIIRSANLTIEVENFDTAFSSIENIILGIGFIQETNINTERYYVDNEIKLIKSGSIVIRVDKAKFDSVINKLRGIGDVFNYTTNGEDVTEQYFDVESRLRLLELEQQKLEAYVAKLDDLDEIFKAESRLTELRYQIESLTGKLNKLSSLVDLSTITVNMNEKRPGYDPQPLTYGDKLLNSLKDSLLQVVEFLGDLLLFIVAAFPVLAFIGLLILLGVWIYKRIIKKHKSNTRFGQNVAAPVQAPAARPADHQDPDQSDMPDQQD